MIVLSVVVQDIIKRKIAQVVKILKLLTLVQCEQFL